MDIIPKKIFQTHKSIEYIKTKPKIQKAINSWRRFCPEFEYYFYTDELCDKFIKDNFDKHIYNLYKNLPLPVMKADLWRYCVIYINGGIYADTDTICLSNPNLLINNSLLTIAPENNVHLCQWTFSAPPKSQILKTIIDLCIERLTNNVDYSNYNFIHHLTGPGLFTDGIEKYLIQNNFTIYSDKTLYSNYYPNSFLKVFNRDIFHTKMIKHLFTGQDYDGWCNERKYYYKKVNRIKISLK
jgi:mannosyltransferase OCH1-like enzyme